MKNTKELIIGTLFTLFIIVAPSIVGWIADNILIYVHPAILMIATVVGFVKLTTWILKNEGIL